MRGARSGTDGDLPIIAAIEERTTMQECPDDLLYSHRHAWVRRVGKPEDGIVRVGLTHLLIEELAEILSIELPNAGEELEIDQDCVHVHTADDIEVMQSPLSAHVREVNAEVLANPDLLHLDAYAHWILELECDDLDEFEILVDARRYARHFETL
jgi:glycine cleavage system H protein